jgi:hypothetical protein
MSINEMPVEARDLIQGKRLDAWKRYRSAATDSVRDRYRTEYERLTLVLRLWGGL